jgi:hypothetical protein
MPRGDNDERTEPADRDDTNIDPVRETPDERD